jgi:hypothetical protein
MVTKLRTAMRRSYNCATCGQEIKIGDKYYDTDEAVNPPKPFPKKKLCTKCGAPK